MVSTAFTAEAAGGVPGVDDGVEPRAVVADEDADL